MASSTAVIKRAATGKHSEATSKRAVRKRSAEPGTPVIDERYAGYKIKIGASKIHRWGVYAGEGIPAHRKVIEYTGERINRKETKRRAETSDMIYLFTLDPYWTIDGSVNGSGAEYINHSCDPNLIARIVKGHILYVSRREIRKGEELTVDYHFDKKVEKVSCGCGSPNCRGTINVR
jgi:SET domain-containing protein